MAHAQISRTQGIPHQPQPGPSYQMPPSGYGARQHSYPNTINSSGVPVGYPGMPVHSSMTQYSSGHFTQGGSNMGGRTNSHGNLARQSRSLGASKASLASQKGGKTSIRREYQDKKLRTNLKSPFYGKGRMPFKISIVLFILGGLLILSGVVVLMLRFHNNIMLSIDKGEIVGPLLIALGIAAIAGGIKFCYDAYVISNSERNKIKFTPASDSLIRATTVNTRSMKAPPGEILMSGTISANAVSRTPHGSMGSLNNI